MVLQDVRRRLRDRRTRRLRDQARSRPPSELAGSVDRLRRVATVDDASARFTAVEALAAVARSGQDHPARDRATDALVDRLANGDQAIQEAVSPELRYVALERPAVIERLDDPYADVLADGTNRARRQVATDLGILVAERGGADRLPAAMAALRDELLGGDRATRRAAATAYVLLASRPDAVDDPATVAEHLAILRGELDQEIPPADSHLRSLADDRTLEDAIAVFREAAEDS